MPTQALLTFLGTGTSMGVPTLACTCAVCVSATSPTGDPRNRRTRPSVLISWNQSQETHNVLIDTGPDFHAQAIREHIRHLDAVLYTHGHADHVLGMDDLRPLTFQTHPFHDGGNTLPLYADDATATTIERVFDYTFGHALPRYPTSARVTLHRIPSTPGAEIAIFDARFLRVPVTHGRHTITGYRFGSAAYLTDLSAIPNESLPLLEDLDLLILDALRREPHPTHSHLANSIALVEQLKPRRAYFTHMSHDLDHAPTEATLPPHIRLAYDGLRLPFTLVPGTGSEEPLNKSLL
jgi:phosphoribosyl 1,2-cyclic phosphate phosphodiesterase